MENQNIHEGSDVMEYLDSVINAYREERHKKIANLIKKSRNQMGLTQSEVAEKLGVTQSWVSKLESGANHSIDNVVEYLECLGFEVKLTVSLSEEIKL